MEIKFKTFHDMMKDCISYLEKKVSVWSANKIISKKKELLVAYSDELQTAAAEQNDNQTNGHTNQKNAAYDEFLDEIYSKCCTLCVYANDNNNMILYTKANVSRSVLENMAEDKFITFATNIIEAIRNDIENLTDYEITSNDVDNLVTNLANLNELTKLRDSVGLDKQEATQSIKDIVAKSRLLLENTDKAIEGMIKDKSFVKGWMGVRKIKGRSQSSSDSSEDANSTVNTKVEDSASE